MRVTGADNATGAHAREGHAFGVPFLHGLREAVTALPRAGAIRLARAANAVILSKAGKEVSMR